ncbi:1718_t:CDS:1, partial [Ambispora leptoticha]
NKVDNTNNEDNSFTDKSIQNDNFNNNSSSDKGLQNYSFNNEKIIFRRKIIMLV